MGNARPPRTGQNPGPCGPNPTAPTARCDTLHPSTRPKCSGAVRTAPVARPSPSPQAKIPKYANLTAPREKVCRAPPNSCSLAGKATIQGDGEADHPFKGEAAWTRRRIRTAASCRGPRRSGRPVGAGASRHWPCRPPSPAHDPVRSPGRVTGRRQSVAEIARFLAGRGRPNPGECGYQRPIYALLTRTGASEPGQSWTQCSPIPRCRSCRCTGPSSWPRCLHSLPHR